MATTCRTASGDVLDTICQNYYGHLNGTVEAGCVNILPGHRIYRSSMQAQPKLPL